MNENGKLPLIRNGENVIDVTYVENVVDALLLCMSAPEACVGQTYNITNGEPMRLSDILSLVFSKLEMEMKQVSIPYPLLYGLSYSLEKVASLFHPEKEPLMTRYTLGVLAKSQTLDITKAKTELGYHPRVTILEGIEAFAAWWQQQEGKR